MRYVSLVPIESYLCYYWQIQHLFSCPGELRPFHEFCLVDTINRYGGFVINFDVEDVVVY